MQRNNRKIINISIVIHSGHKVRALKTQGICKTDGYCTILWHVFTCTCAHVLIMQYTILCVQEMMKWQKLLKCYELVTVLKKDAGTKSRWAKPTLQEQDQAKSNMKEITVQVCGVCLKEDDSETVECGCCQL